MTVKRRISLLVAGAGFAASLLFSLAVFIELVEQPFQILDEELKEEALRAAHDVAARLKTGEPTEFHLEDGDVKELWLKVFDRTSGQLVYQSKFAESVDIGQIEPGAAKTMTMILPTDAFDQEQKGQKEHTIRARMFSFNIEGNELLVQIACTMNKFWEEIWDLVFSLIAGLVLSSLILIAISHYVAGKILQPIGKMKAMTKDISEKNLDRRLPVGPEKDEFNELAKTINRMLDRLQYSFEKQRDFLFDTSHELKTPLTTMRLAIDEICTTDIEKLPDSTGENLLRLNEQVRRMDRLVKDLLNLSALEMIDTIEARPLSLKMIIEPLIDEYRFIAEAKNIRIDFSLPEFTEIQGDGEKLTRAFSNILDNAIKYNITGGTVTVKGNEADGSAAISITNTGPGISEEDIDKVFDQFFRVEKSRSIKLGGSGLGLAIVKRIIELHNGKVRLESRPGRWTSVSVKLPFEQPDSLS
jgi:two-component system OmpR family sensor kinase